MCVGGRGGLGVSLTTARCPFLALTTRSSAPQVKSMMPSLPRAIANLILRKKCRITSEFLSSPESHLALTVHSLSLSHTPVLTDIDVVYLVRQDGQFGDRLDHVVTLQHQVALKAESGKVKVCQVSHVKQQVDVSHLLLAVSSGHVQDKKAITEGTNRDA